MLETLDPEMTSVWKQIGNPYFQRFGEGRDDQERRVSFAALHAPDVCPMMIGSCSKFLLAPALFLAERAYPFAKLFLHRLHTRMKPG